jgi:hypothetical protein
MERSRLRPCHRCSGFERAPLPPEEAALFAAAHTLDGVQAHLNRACEPSATALWVLSINCRGVGEKLDRLTALLVETGPDVVCLPKAAGLAAMGDLGVLGYRLIACVERRGGGLVTLVHHRLLPRGRVPSTRCPEHGYLLAVTVQLTPSSQLRVGNLHIPPAVPPDERTAEGGCVHGCGPRD